MGRETQISDFHLLIWLSSIHAAKFGRVPSVTSECGVWEKKWT